MTTRAYLVPAISCAHCKSSIEAEVSKVADVAEVRVDIDSKTVTVVGGADDAIRAAIDEAGYAVA